MYKKESFNDLGKIGSGTFGEVYKYEEIRTNTIYAMKIMKLSNIQIYNANLVEVEILKKLSPDPNIVNLYKYFNDQRSLTIYLLLELMDNGSLGSVDRYLGTASLNRQCFDYIIVAFPAALKKLRAENIIHRDIKPDNVLIDKNGFLKLCDFGTACTPDKASGIQGTWGYIAPEVVTKKNYSFTADYFSFGAMLFQLRYRRRVVEARRIDTDKVLKEKTARPVAVEEKNPDLKEYLQSLLHHNPEERAGRNCISELLSFSYVSSMDKEGIENRTFPSPFIDYKRCQTEAGLKS